MTTKEGFADPEITQSEGNVNFFLILDYLVDKTFF